MLSSRFRPILIAIVGACILPVAAYAATGTAATASSSGNSATLTLSAKAKKSLTREGVTLTAKRPATRKKSSYALTGGSGNWNFTNATGTLNFKGVLHIVLKKQSLNIKYVTLKRPAKGNGTVVANVAGHKKVNLFTITGKAHISDSGVTETITGLTAKLTKPGASRIDSKLRSKAIKSGQSLGSFTIVVATSSVAAGAPGSGTTPPVTGTSSSGLGVDLAPDFRELLGSTGLSTVPIVPASNGLPAPLGTTTIPGADGTSVSLPLDGSSASAGFDDGTLTGTVPLSGGLELDNGAAQVSLTNPTLTLGTGAEGSGLSFSVNGGPEAQLFDINTSDLEQSATPDGELDLSGLLATLSSEGAQTLNTVLGTDAFTTGQPVGGLTLILPESSSSSSS
jgi:hypothetical protein